MTEFDPFNPLQGVTPRFTKEQLALITTWFDATAKPLLLINEEPYNVVSIEEVMNFISLKKFHRRSFHYPSYFEIMVLAEKLKAGTNRLLLKDQVIYMLDNLVIEPDIKHELQLAFKIFDSEKRNYLETDDIKIILTGFENGFTEAETAEILRDADITGNGRIIYEDFIESIFNVLPELRQEKVQYLYENPNEDPSVEPEPEPEPEPVRKPKRVAPPPPPPAPPAKKGKEKKK